MMRPNLDYGSWKVGKVPSKVAENKKFLLRCSLFPREILALYYKGYHLFSVVFYPLEKT